MIPRFITNLILGRKVPVYGDGKYIRDWLYVEDHCRAIEVAMLGGEPGETYCVGGQHALSNNLEVTRMIIKFLGKDNSFIEYVKDRPGHDRKYAVGWKKIESELGWKPQHDFETWLENTVVWYKQNDWWWKPLKAKAEAFYRKST